MYILHTWQHNLKTFNAAYCPYQNPYDLSQNIQGDPIKTLPKMKMIFCPLFLIWYLWILFCHKESVIEHLAWKNDSFWLSGFQDMVQWTMSQQNRIVHGAKEWLNTIATSKVVISTVLPLFSISHMSSLICDALGSAGVHVLNSSWCHTRSDGGF